MHDTFFPSLLDRLDGNFVKHRFAGSKFRGVSSAEYRQMVVRDLKRLLNHSSFFVSARQGESLNRPSDVTSSAASFPLASESVLNYGMYLHSGTAVSGAVIALIGRNIRDAIECFEPRLRNIRVDLLKEPTEDSDDGPKRDPGKLRFLVEADIIMEPVLETFRVLTELDLVSGQCEIPDSTPDSGNEN